MNNRKILTFNSEKIFLKKFVFKSKKAIYLHSQKRKEVLKHERMWCNW